MKAFKTNLKASDQLNLAHHLSRIFSQENCPKKRDINGKSDFAALSKIAYKARHL